MTDPLDQPEGEAMSLVLPFVVCKSQGGPYDDEGFVAGFQAGDIDRALTMAAATGATHVAYPIVHTGLLPQLELIGMRRGFPTVKVDTSKKWPGWSAVTFIAAGHDETGERP